MRLQDTRRRPLLLLHFPLGPFAEILFAFSMSCRFDPDAFELHCDWIVENPAKQASKE